MLVAKASAILDLLVMMIFYILRNVLGRDC